MTLAKIQLTFGFVRHGLRYLWILHIYHFRSGMTPAAGLPRPRPIAPGAIGMIDCRYAGRLAARGVIRVHGRVGRMARRPPRGFARPLAQDREEGVGGPEHLLLRCR